MSPIQQKLIELVGAVDNLEVSLTDVEATLQSRQHDMFTPLANGNSTIFAEKLDQTIEKVETILKEG